MAQIIERIVRSKYPPRDTRVLWLDTKDDLLKTFTSNGSPNADLSKIGINQDEVVVNLYYSRIANINVKKIIVQKY